MIYQLAPHYFTPETLNMLQRIFDDVTRLHWFPNHPAEYNQFAIDLISFYENGLTERHTLRQFALAHAERNYAPQRRCPGGKPEEASPGM
ncbi:cytidine deaminase [Rhizobiaceae bacterium n13]|uniref:Cytidine deaminase n=1 Tax=Ferirhizobium litorale TaxID=2927786 RepID=A0AAE3QHA1_9HYPH|nr:hypothetical protein [Fererhizobium litorale]MDI7865305.1 cytidine deaminase [Fererhizobium litorale]MDI7925210.1 cytidine deaminase [Fererhizobium litorale]